MEIKKLTKLDIVTRIEGNAKVTIALNDQGEAEYATLHVLELRGFEKIMEGMEADKMPLITARICGICPVSHQLASVKALEHAYGIEPPKAAKMLRELMTMGQCINSHGLHLVAIGGPDFLMDEHTTRLERNINGLLRIRPDLAKRGLRLRALGQIITEEIGGRSIHPIAATVGGIKFICTTELREKLKEICQEAFDLAKFLIKEIKGPICKFIENTSEIKMETLYMGTVDEDDALNLYNGRLKVIDANGKPANLVSRSGETNSSGYLDCSQYDDYIIEKNLNGVYIEDIEKYLGKDTKEIYGSYMKGTYLRTTKGEEIYRVNSLARLNCATKIKTKEAQKEFEEFKNNYGKPCHKTALFYYARAIELLYACERALELILDDAIIGDNFIPVVNRTAGRGVGHVEAPRGTLIHDYRIGENQTIEKVNLLVATQQNYSAINMTMLQAYKKFRIDNLSDEQIGDKVESCLRCYDPCLSCATHAVGKSGLEIFITKENRLVRHIRL